MIETADKLDRLTAGLALSVDIINDILQASAAGLDPVIDSVLARLGQFTQSDRTYVFRVRDERLLDNTHEWMADDIKPARDDLQGIPLEIADHWWRAFEQEGVLYIPDVDQLDAEHPEKNLLQAQAIKSLLVVPMRIDGVPCGFVGYDSVRHHREFLPGEIDLIQTVANVISFALEKRDAVRMSELAKIDMLTKLPNRYQFSLCAERALHRAERTGEYGAVLFIDIDNFKQVNDTYGHRFGDSLLCEYAARLQLVTRASDMAARYSGDEFVILVEQLGTEVEAAEALVRELAQRLVDSITHPMLIDHESGQVTLHIRSSLGIALFNSADQEMAQVIERADKAMYDSKNGVEHYKFA